MYCIYLLTSPSGKQYVGLTKNFEQRMDRYARGKGGRQRAIKAAILQYGFPSFGKDILESGLTMEQAIEAEKRWIKEKGTLAPSGYNLTTGGENGVLSAESIEIISAKGKRRFANPEARAEVSRHRKAFFAKNGVSEAERVRLQRLAAEGWADPKRREGFVAAAKKRWSNTDACREVSDRQKEWHRRVRECRPAYEALCEINRRGTPKERKVELRLLIKKLLDSQTQR